MKHQRNYVQPPGERNNAPSMTVPGQTLPIRTLVERYRRGADVAVFNGTYTEDEDVVGISKLDKVDRAQLALDVKHTVQKNRALLQFHAKKELQKAEHTQTSSQDDAITSLDV